MALSNKLIPDNGLFHNSCEMKVHIREIPIITLLCVLDNRRMWKNYNFNREENYFICEVLKQASFQKKIFFINSAEEKCGPGQEFHYFSFQRKYCTNEDSLPNAIFVMLLYIQCSGFALIAFTEDVYCP